MQTSKVSPADDRMRSMLEFSPEDLDVILELLLRVANDKLAGFFESHGLPKSGTKAVYRKRIEQGLAAGVLTTDDLLDFVDEQAQWGKQHIYILAPPARANRPWRRRDDARKQLNDAGVDGLLDSPLRLLLPQGLTLSRIHHDEIQLVVIAIAGREVEHREKELDFDSSLDDGRTVEYRAYIRETVRNVVRFEWDLIANEAMLQISQLPSGIEYEQVRAEFEASVSSWLDLSLFTTVDLQTVIRRVHELEEQGTGEVRSVGMDYDTLGGRRFTARSGSPSAPLIGELATDTALRALRASGVGRVGNFYWLEDQTTALVSDLHVYVTPTNGTISITRPQTEHAVRHVVNRIRTLSA